MNLLLTTLLAASLLTPTSARPTAVEPDSGSVAFTTASVWLRVSPAFDTTGIALLPRGAQVRIIECRKQTCKVEFRRLQGFVLRELLRTTAVTNPVDPGQGYINSKGQWIPADFHPLDPETALAVLMGEHRLSIPIYIGEASEPPTTEALLLP
jgi:hypothetical protein